MGLRRKPKSGEAAAGDALLLEGRGEVRLSTTDHVATGGEGSVYRCGDTAIKLFTDASAMRQTGRPEKIGLLSAIRHPTIVAPRGLVRDGSRDVVGYWMDFAEGWPLARLFTSDFRQRMGFDLADTIVLVEQMREAVAAAHGYGAVLADANELNYLVRLGGPDGPDPRLVDVDSWSIGRFPAAVVMPSIRDWHSKVPCQGSDWFAWAIVTFQLFAGIHPYKGTAVGFERFDLEGRMRANVSVLNKAVRVNRAVRDFAAIPAPLSSWYEGVLEHGDRSPPPRVEERQAALTGGTCARPMPVAVTDKLDIQLLLERVGQQVDRVHWCGVARLTSGALVEVASGRTITSDVRPDAEVVVREGRWLICDGESLRIVERNGVETAAALPVAGGRVVRGGNRLFIAGAALTEIEVRFIAGRALVAAGRSWPLLPNATRWVDDIGVQNALGATWLIAVFGRGGCAHLRVPELDGMSLLAARLGGPAMVVTGMDRQGAAFRHSLVWDAGYRTYTIASDAVASGDLNAAMLDNGVVALIDEDGELMVTVPATGETRIVRDAAISSSMRLAVMGERVVAVVDGRLVGIAMRTVA